jgi:hypothetical protein
VALVLVLIAAALPLWAQVTAAELDYERTSASNALSMLEQQVVAASAPSKVLGWLQIGREQTEQLLQTDDPRAAKRAFLRASRAFARVSRWLQTQADGDDEDASASEGTRLQRLREKLQRLVQHLTQLGQVARPQSVPLELTTAIHHARATKQALAKGEVRAARSALLALRAAVDALQEQLDDALDARDVQ